MKASRISLAAACLLLIVFSIIGRGDMPASDPIWYGAIGHDLSIDPVAVFAGHETHPFVMRVGLTMPLALFYKLFGVSAWTTNLPCLLAALGIVGVVYAAAPTPRAKVIGMVLAATSIPLLRALQLNVDLPCAALMGASVLCLSRRWLIAAMLAWFAAFLVKETALWCAPVWIYAFVISPDRRRFVPALAIGAVLGIVYLWICARVWGSPFARFHGIQDLTYEHTWSLHGKSAGAWAARLVWQVPMLLAKLFLVSVLALPLAPRFVKPEHRIWIVATLTFTLLYWFGSSSLSAYSPLPISQRMVLPVLPGFLVLGALVGDALLDRLRWWPVLAVALVLPGVIEMGTSIYRGHPEADAFAVLSSEPRPLLLVCGEPRCGPIANFYFGFEKPPDITVVFAHDFVKSPRPTGTIRALVNTTRAAGARAAGQDFTGAIDAAKLPAIYRSRHVRLYDATTLWDALVRSSDKASEIRPDTDKPLQ